METCMDIMNFLEPDMSLKVLLCLDHPSDLIRASAVSRSWYRFVIANGLCKKLCLRLFPQLSNVVRVAESSYCMEKPLDAGSSSAMEWENLDMEHRIYAFLAHGLTSFAISSCILQAIIASSTDNFPRETIDNTLNPGDRIGERASYWSSEGQSHPSVPETLLYKLVSNLCVITEIDIQPFQAFFQLGNPIYSAKSVRFRMGHLNFSMDHKSDLLGVASRPSTDEKFVWTYTSPEFPMAQKNCVQKFKLPEPVLCICGILQVELLGRVQRQDMDGLFYICVAHVQVLGRQLSPPFDVQIVEPSGKFLLHHYPQANNQPNFAEDENQTASDRHILPPEIVQRNMRGWEQILNVLRGNIPAIPDYVWDEEQEESDEEYLN